jgi:hypothetical protein
MTKKNKDEIWDEKFHAYKIYVEQKAALKLKNASRSHLLTGWRRFGNSYTHPEMLIDVTKIEEDTKKLKCNRCLETWTIAESFKAAKESAADHFQAVHGVLVTDP